MDQREGGKLEEAKKFDPEIIDMAEEFSSVNLEFDELKDKKEAVETFKKQYSKGDFSEARRTLDAMRIDHYPEVMYFRAMLEMKSSNNDEAIRYFKRVVSSEKVGFITVQSYICLAFLCTKRGNYKMALTYLDILTGSELESAQIYSMIGYCQMEEKNFDLALEAYRSALLFDEENENINNSYGYLLLLLGNLEEGLSHVKKALLKNPKNYAYLHSMGMYYFLKKRYAEAMNYFKTSYNIKHHPTTKKHMDICLKNL